MRLKLIASGACFIASQLFAADFHPNPSWVVDPQGKSGYTVYASYTEVPPVEAEDPEFDPEGIVRFSNRIWRGATAQFLEKRVNAQTIGGKPCDSSVLLKNGGKWVEIGRAPLQDPNIAYHQAFLFYEWDQNGGGARKSSFFIKDEIGTLKLGEVIEVGNGLALIKIGVDANEWINLVIIDLNNFRPKGAIALSALEITNFTEGQALTIRYKEPASRAQVLSNPNVVSDMPWIELDVVTNGILNPDLIDETQFEISIPAMQ